ncbi:hypothetical protein O6H91_02G046200 [Diphasiastrum complanatum]|uniref:Uncharacterized protein n=1 Tax=Diphasiastrum complanatum TaxID=34168 RepID=A0ACC2EFD4_DIPCM|nr:hypothetical protein O6H91_02G046200 [Diphasiastrum complanatum]
MGSDKQIKICSTGRDGCMCKYMYNNGCAINEAKDEPIVCISVEKVTAITVVESLDCFQGGIGKSKDRRVAAGFAAGDFVIWDLTDEIEVVRVPCGGWRRPHSYLIGEACEFQHCFIFTKDWTIHVHRRWTCYPLSRISPYLVEKIDQTQSINTIFPSQQVLQKQFHGKEIHCVQFVPVQNICSSASSASWIATGSEDGTVRITRCSQASKVQLDVAMSFGEHVGGSAVRALTLVSEVHTFGQGSGFPALDEGELLLSLEAHHFESTPLLLLLSAGAKEVLTCWKLEWVTKLDQCQSYNPSPDYMPCILLDDLRVSDGHVQKLESTWLSSHIPLRSCKPSALITQGEASKSRHNKNQAISGIQKSFLKSAFQQSSVHPKEPANASPTETNWAKGKLSEELAGSTDLRYLSLTAFSTCCAQTGFVICFIVAASSDATLSMHAFDTSTRSWVKVAVLEYHLAPVLVVQHIAIPCPQSGPFEKLFMVLSGATDGNIAVWDVTHVIIDFINSYRGPNQSFVPAPLRPFTGRGSEGGRRWKSSRHKTVALQELMQLNEFHSVHMEQNRTLKKVGDLFTEAQGSNDYLKRDVNPHKFHADISSENQDSAKPDETENSTSECNGVSVVCPVHVFNNAHQSGVNCMSISEVKCEKQFTTEAGLMFLLVSGGDDQAMHVATFTLQSGTSEHEPFSSSMRGFQDGAEAYKSEQYFNNGALLTNGGSDGFVHQNSSKSHKIIEERSTKPYFKLLVMNECVLQSGHNSALKGVWTNGEIVFSIGLDQRLRGWYLQPFDSLIPLIEFCNCVIDVPEVEALAVESRLDSEHYRIAVVGRGLQVIDYYRAS